jgi:type I restriction enzyme, S subunit
MLLWANANMSEIKGRVSGTTFPEISKTNFRPIQILVPSSQVMKEFNKIVRPLFEKITANLEESQTLATLRDTLLPHLMRGDVMVSKTDQ